MNYTIHYAYLYNFIKLNLSNVELSFAVEHAASEEQAWIGLSIQKSWFQHQSRLAFVSVDLYASIAVVRNC
jgi:hypothetical protein